MVPRPERIIEICNCSAVRQAARHITQFYDQHLAEAGLRTTQYAILAKLDHLGPMTIGALADVMVMDRTTLGRNIKPLERERLIAIEEGQADRRQKVLRVTADGAKRLRVASKAWAAAQANFERAFGRNEAKAMREMLCAVTDCDLSRPEDDRR